MNKQRLEKMTDDELKQTLIQRKKKIEQQGQSVVDNLSARAHRIERRYGFKGTTEISIMCRSNAKLIQNDLKYKIAEIDKALAELEKGNPEKAQEVLKNEMPDWYNFIREIEELA